MPFGFGKPRRRRQLADLPDDWVGWLEPGVEVDGKIKVTAGLIRVNTHVNGEIMCEGTVVVHDEGDVRGDIHTRKISVSGKIEGAVHASESLEIKEHGVVFGDIYTPCLVVDPGGFFDGQCHMPTPEPTTQTTQALDTKNHHP
jgi:cytoskeletal protein CcmA (bactofilin family)